MYIYNITALKIRKIGIILEKNSFFRFLYFFNFSRAFYAVLFNEKIEGKVPKFYHERDESGATSVSPKHRLRKECSIKSLSHKNTVVAVSKKKIGNLQNVQNENNPKVQKVFAKSPTKILKSDSNRNRIVKATKNTLPPNQKLISQYFRHLFYFSFY